MTLLAKNITDLLRITRTGERDIDSTNLDFHVGDKLIGHGHLNNRTNFAHVTIESGLSEELECEITDYITEGIENRTLKID